MCFPDGLHLEPNDEYYKYPAQLCAVIYPIYAILERLVRWRWRTDYRTSAGVDKYRSINVTANLCERHTDERA